MLGRNAARPLGMIPGRLVTAYSSVAAHRLAHWMMSRPFAMATMQRYLSIAPQYLLTPASGNGNSSSSSSQGISTPTLVALDGSATNSAQSSCQLHTSTTATATAAALLQHQPPPLLAHDILLPPDLFGTSTLSSSTSSSSSDTTASEVIPPTVAIPTPSSHNAIAYNYLLAASWHPKSRQRQQQQQQMQQVQKAQADAEAAKTARTLLWKEKLKAAHPHPGKVNAGEDAFFHVSTRSRVALGVADGVGGWSELGVDPALFSWALMNNAENIARLTDCVPPEIDPPTAGSERSILDAQTILDGAYNELVQSGTVEAGSSTACILSLCKTTGTLRASNLGDSAFLLIRDNKCIYESPSQQHFWNCPYQLTVLPKDRQQQQQQQQQQRSSENDGKGNSTQQDATAAPTVGAKKAKKYVQDLPKDAVQTTHQLQDGDVIVLATDGFWDNVFTKEAIELVDRELGDIIRDQQLLHSTTHRLSSAGEIVEAMSADEILARVRALSKRLTNTARRFSLDAKRMTPFSQGARHIQSGGKVDDITVIVTLVRSTAP